MAIKLAFGTTNNVAEYEAVLARLGMAKELGIKNLEIRSDSQVVLGHTQGEFEARYNKMIKYLAKVKSFQTHLDKMVITQIPRNDNTRADSLARLGPGTYQEIEASKQKVRVLTQLSIIGTEEVIQIEDTYDDPSWAMDII